MQSISNYPTSFFNQLFESKPVRVYGDDEKPLFVVKDIGKINHENDEVLKNIEILYDENHDVGPSNTLT